MRAIKAGLIATLIAIAVIGCVGVGFNQPLDCNYPHAHGGETVIMDEYICENGHKMVNWQTNPPPIGGTHERPCKKCDTELTRVN